MRRRPWLVGAVLGVGLLWARDGFAQQLGPVSGGLVTSKAPPLSPANGVQLAGGALFHSGVGVEGGYDTNVFYNDDGRAASTVLRVTPFIDLTNTARSGEVPSGLFYDLHALLVYREYFSNEADVTRLRSFTPTVSASLEHNSNGEVVLGATEVFTRSEDAPYIRGPSQSLLIRDNNAASLQLRWAPGGGRLQGLLRYTNQIDWFETDYLKPASSMGHEGMLDLSWRWLPKTALYAQVRQGYISYLNSDPGMTLAATAKSSSYPLRAFLGIRGLITEKTSVAIALGYQHGFYTAGVDTGGLLGSTSAAGEVVFIPIMASRISLGVRHDFQNSVIGNFYYNDGVYATLAQTADRLVGQLWGSFDYRRFYGLPGAQDPRRDKFIQAGVMLDYYLSSWAYAGVSYSLNLNRSDYQPTSGSSLAGVNYTKQQMFARLGLTY